MTAMQVLSYPEFGRLETGEAALPVCAPGEVLLRVAACGLCGSELETFKNKSSRRLPPIVMGHEFCGEITAIGPGATDWQVGQRVVSNSLVPCGECIRCQRGDTHLCAARQIFGMHRPGAFAEFVNVPARCLLVWPQNVPARAACLAEPLANGVHMVNLTRHLQPQTVLVIGAGPIGLMAQQAFAVMAGARVIVADLSSERLAVAAKLGAEHTFDPRETDVVEFAQSYTSGEGVDLVIDAVGSSTTKRQSLEAARPGGAAVWIGLHQDAMSLDSYQVTLPEKQIFGTYSATLDELQTALDLMGSGQVDVTSWVTAAPLSEGVEIFGRMLRAQGNDIKAVLLPDAVNGAGEGLS